ncbi:RNA polymerase sigma factor [Conexibacter sp. CPCC 206217]|uniref:RNA polymerase sigma factor n=1 Tax=Conexibacter sp. CPCC 206217 TaxID=3064574 RepID=UPI0027286BD4|nr:RNA polymerase sigma factor [Conexibacter sp. CPCC 206217]MDO8213604.1 RNA polymerase sigma factor [Conexibacter sp. CPCC 206217]
MSRLEPHAVVRHLDRLYRAAWALCGSREDAEDLVQETVTRVLARPRRLRGEEELGYLLSALRNTFLTSRRTASRRPQEVATLDDLALGDPRPGGRPEAALEAHELFAAIARLPDDFRLALIAVDVVGLSYREAAKSLGTREATITSRLHRARERVTADLTGRSGGSPEGSPSSRSLLS